MAYLNPYLFFDLDHLSGPGEVDAALIRRLRKKVLAEFELTEATSVDWKGQQVDKATALGIADELEDPHRRDMHWKVFRVPGLSDFLRHPDPDKLRRLPPRNQIQDAALLHFIQPWLRDSLAQLLNEYLRSQMYQSCTLVLHKMELLESDEQEKALEKFRVWALELERSLDALIEKMNAGTRYLITQIRDYYEAGRISLLNAAPDSISFIRAGYAKSLCNLAVALYNHLGDSKYSQEALQAALSLKTDALTREKAQELALELRKRNNQTQAYAAGAARARAQSNDTAPYRVILIILILCVKVFLISRGCSRRSSVPDYHIPDFSRYDQYTPPPVVSTRPITLDSLMTLLDAAPEQRPEGAQPDISHAGARIYSEPRRDVYRKVIENRYSDNTHQGELSIHNRTGLDVIVFVYSGEFTPEVFTAYIPSGEQTWLHVNGSLNMDITYTAGKKYVDPLLVLDNGLLDVPGFAEPKTWFYQKSEGRFPSPRGEMQFQGAPGSTDSLRITLSRKAITVNPF